MSDSFCQDLKGILAVFLRVDTIKRQEMGDTGVDRRAPEGFITIPSKDE